MKSNWVFILWLIISAFWWFGLWKWLAAMRRTRKISTITLILGVIVIGFCIMGMLYSLLLHLESAFLR